MRVLNVNKYYYLRGGAERYFFQLAHLLESRGHEVIPFAMKGERNEPSDYEPYFVSEIDFRSQDSWTGRLRASGRVLYSLEARRRIEDLVRDTRPDVAHLHNIAHQLSPSILGPLRMAGMRVVQTLHDYKLVCPTYRLYVDGQVCERCRGGRYFEAIRHRCNQGSWRASFLNAVEMTLHHWILTSYRRIDAFVAPSRFMKQKVVEFGIPERKVMYLPLYLDLSEFADSAENGDAVVYVGRLSDEKGLLTLLRAMAEVPGASLVIVGEGPMEETLRQEAERSAPGRVNFTGYLDGPELKSVVGSARCVVVPSEWYENSPLTIFESFALGRPVVGSRIGGIPEFVIHEQTGLLFDPGDVEGLAENLRRLVDDPGLARELGREARTYIEALTDRERHLAGLERVYRDAPEADSGPV